MKICMVLNGYFPPDIRVEKEARALIRAGHEIYLLSLGKKGMSSTEYYKGINILRIFPSESFLGRILDFISFGMFFDSPYWKKALINIIKQYKIDVIHVHDLPMVKTATTVAKEFNIPVVADLHENYPEGLRFWRRGITTWKRILLNLVSPVWRWKKLEKSVLHRVDRIITVVDEAKEHYVKDCGVSPEKITVIMNVVDLNKFNNLKINYSLVRKYENNFIISYIGGFGPHRGLDTAIKAMPKVLEEIPDAKLLLVGEKSPKGYGMYLRKLCKDLKIENNVEFTGWVDFSLVPTYIALSDVCLVPHHASEHTNTTVPHKLFQYMAMGKPVIVTDCKPLKRIVEECKCGVVVSSGDYNKMAEAIVMLYQNKEYARELGKNGRRAVEEKYNWENEARKLCKLYEELEKGVKV